MVRIRITYLCILDFSFRSYLIFFGVDRPSPSRALALALEHEGNIERNGNRVLIINEYL